MAITVSAPLSALTHAFIAASAVDEVITARQLALLGMLVEDARRSTAHYAQLMAVSKPAITRATHKLLLLGLAECHPHTTDRRLVVLAASEAGRRTWERLRGFLHQTGGLAMAKEMLAFARSGAGFAYPLGSLQKLERLVETQGASWE